ncbi:hypothetical protein AB8A20_11670 [Tardiphaga sp. 604_B6_N1_1]|uniref:hypothetical protein n=1 Tax=Tardiphaga sp. 604_B6_N1_1 TaxID=3240779 RepID=UPI003F25D39A
MFTEVYAAADAPQQSRSSGSATPNHTNGSTAVSPRVNLVFDRFSKTLLSAKVVEHTDGEVG